MKIFFMLVMVILIASCSRSKETSNQKAARSLSKDYRKGKVSEEDFIKERVKQTTAIRDRTSAPSFD